MSIFQNARVYWEMYGGVPPEGNDQHVQAVDLTMDVGGWAADDYAYFQVSVYGRKNVNSPNLVTLYREPLHRPTGSIMWKPVRISERVTNTDVRCIVVKVELIEQTYVAPDGSSHVMNYSDQYMDADAPPWGIRIHEDDSHIYGSDLVRDVRAHKVFADILAGRGFTYSGPVATWTPDQLDFTDIPYDRQDAIDDVNGMLGWNYACWDGTEVEFALPKSGTAHVIAAGDPRTTWSVEESLDETYNAVRVCYGNKRGKLREVIVHGNTAALRGTVRADTLQAPESIKSEKAATRFAKRYLASHETKQVAGSVSIQGSSTVVTASGYTANIIPVMTSATIPSGVASASGSYDPGHAEWMAFDHRIGNGEVWVNSYGWFHAGTTGQLQYQFPAAHVVTRYAIKTGAESTWFCAPKSWTFKGSNNGSTWVTLDTRTNVTDWASVQGMREVFDFANTTPYLYYRLDITASNHASYVSVGELEMMETTFVDVVDDPLLIRPGDTVKMTGPARSLSGTHEVTGVTLRPLEWAADVEFGTNSKRFDTWLARLAAGAKSIKRR